MFFHLNLYLFCAFLWLSLAVFVGVNSCLNIFWCLLVLIRGQENDYWLMMNDYCFLNTKYDIRYTQYAARSTQNAVRKDSIGERIVAAVSWRFFENLTEYARFFLLPVVECIKTECRIENWEWRIENIKFYLLTYALFLVFISVY
jgi:hypothetical protein